MYTAVFIHDVKRISDCRYYDSYQDHEKHEIEDSTFERVYGGGSQGWVELTSGSAECDTWHGRTTGK